MPFPRRRAARSTRVVPDGTPPLPEIAVLRSTAHRTFGLRRARNVGTRRWPIGRMRAAVARVGEHLRAAHGCRGAFGIDGVLTADGFRLTEPNTRMSAGATTAAEVDARFFASCRPTSSPGSTLASRSRRRGWVEQMDAERTGR